MRLVAYAAAAAVSFWGLNAPRAEADVINITVTGTVFPGYGDVDSSGFFGPAGEAHPNEPFTADLSFEGPLVYSPTLAAVTPVSATLAVDGISYSLPTPSATLQAGIGTKNGEVKEQVVNLQFGQYALQAMAEPFPDEPLYDISYANGVTTINITHSPHLLYGAVSELVESGGQLNEAISQITISGELPTFASPLPEPSTWSLTLLGVALVGALYRHRRGGDRGATADI